MEVQVSNNLDGFLGYVDTNHSGDRDSGKSTIGYVFTVAGTAVSWIS